MGCQSDGPSGQNLYNAVRPLHVSRKDNDAEAMAQDDPWASSWRRSGQSIGKSPRSSWVAPGGSESYREEMPPRFAEGLSSTLRVKPLLAAAPHEQQGRPKMPTSPRNGNPYRRKRAASMVSKPTTAVGVGQGALRCPEICNFSLGMPKARGWFLTSSLNPFCPMNIGHTAGVYYVEANSSGRGNRGGREPIR